MKKSSIIFLVIAVVAAGLAYYFYSQLARLKADPLKTSREEVHVLVAQVSKLMVLPSDEEPTVATVSDPDLLKDEPFFAKAKAGDKVLIYTKNKRAILYDPVAKRILDVAPVNIGNSLTPRP